MLFIFFLSLRNISAAITLRTLSHIKDFKHLCCACGSCAMAVQHSQNTRVKCSDFELLPAVEHRMDWKPLQPQSQLSFPRQRETNGVRREQMSTDLQRCSTCFTLISKHQRLRGQAFWPFLYVTWYKYAANFSSHSFGIIIPSSSTFIRINSFSSPFFLLHLHKVIQLAC